MCILLHDKIKVERQAIQALGKVEDPVLLSDVYGYCIAEGKIRPQDIPVSCLIWTINLDKCYHKNWNK